MEDKKKKKDDKKKREASQKVSSVIKNCWFCIDFEESLWYSSIYIIPAYLAGIIFV